MGGSKSVACSAAGLGGFTEIGKLAESGKTIGYGLLRNSKLPCNLLLGMTSQPKLEDAAVAGLLGVLVDAGEAKRSPAEVRGAYPSQSGVAETGESIPLRVS